MVRQVSNFRILSQPPPPPPPCVPLQCAPGYTWNSALCRCVLLPPPPPNGEYTGRQIVVTPQNYQTLLINDELVDYTGTTSEYVRIYKPAPGSGPAIVCDYENLEIELDVHTESGSGRLYQLCTRGGRHTSVGDPCTGSCYKGAFGSTSPHFRKELFHRSSTLPGGNGYCDDRITGRQSYSSIMDKRALIKFRCRNIESSGDVQIENFVNDVRVQIAYDRGDWPRNTSVLPVCPPLEFGNTGNRRQNEKLNKAGVWVILRADYTRHRMYRCTIREMHPVTGTPTMLHGEGLRLANLI